LKLFWPVEAEIVRAEGNKFKIRTAKGETAAGESTYLTVSGLLLVDHSQYRASRVSLVEWDGDIRNADCYADPRFLVLIPKQDEGTFLFFDGKLREYSGKLFRSEYLSTFGNSYFYGAPGYYIVVSTLYGALNAMLPLDKSVEPEEVSHSSARILSSDNVLIELKGGDKITLSGFPLKLFAEPSELVLHASSGFVRVPADSLFAVVPDVRSADDAYCQYTRALGVLYADGDYLTLTDGVREDRVKLPTAPESLEVDALVEYAHGDRKIAVAVATVTYGTDTEDIYIDVDKLRLLKRDGLLDELGISSLIEAEMRGNPFSEYSESCVPIYGDGSVHSLSVGADAPIQYKAVLARANGDGADLYYLLYGSVYSVLLDAHPCTTYAEFNGALFTPGYRITHRCGELLLKIENEFELYRHSLTVSRGSSAREYDCHVFPFWVHVLVHADGGAEVADIDELVEVLDKYCYPLHYSSKKTEALEEIEAVGVPPAVVRAKLHGL